MAKSIPAELLIDITRRLLNAGVPPTAIANAFEMDPEPIRRLQSQIRREVYGTSELSEAMQFLLWSAYEESMRTLKSGSPDMRHKVMTNLLSKAMAASARQTPEELQDLRSEFAAFVSDTAAIASADLAADYEAERSEYVNVVDAELIDD